MARNKNDHLNEPPKTIKPQKSNSSKKNNGRKDTDLVDLADADFAAKCKILGENIRRERKARGFSIENLAEYLELSTSYVGLLERGARCPSLKNFFNICDLFSSTPNNLILDRDADTTKLMVSEQKFSAKKNNYNAIISLLQSLNENELGFVVEVLKSLKKMQKKV